MEIQTKERLFPIEAREALEDTDEDSRTHEQKIALENLTRHTAVEDSETLETLHDELSEIESLKEKHIYKLLGVMPQYESTLRGIFSDERIRLDDSEYDEILDICQSVESEE